MAAIRSIEMGAKTTVIEKMSAPGRKILMSGKGRCNITNACDVPDLIKNMPGNGRFLHSAYRMFNNSDVVEWLNKNGVETKIERGGRVFPVSDKAEDVVNAFVSYLRRHKVNFFFKHLCQDLLIEDGRVVGVRTDQGNFMADAVILATGGATYPGTGSSGDGYRLAKAAGHTIIPLKPSLVPLEVAEDWVKDLQGLSLKNVEASVLVDKNKVASDFGEMLFTHFGLSGPIILSLSRTITAALDEGKRDIILEINLKPALTEEVLDKRVQRDWEKFSRRQFKNSLGELLPSKLIPVILDQAFLDPDKFVNQATKTERLRLIKLLQHLSFSVTRPRPLAEAIVTAGGINTKEINPATMESKLVPGLYFAGEVIDIDGYTGGFNLQAAFSTGYVAACGAAKEMEHE